VVGFSNFLLFLELKAKGGEIRGVNSFRRHVGHAIAGASCHVH